MATVARALLFTLLLFGLAAQAEESRSVWGIVTDKRGNPLPGAVVQIDNAMTKGIQSYIVQRDGRYHFEDLNSNVEFVLHAKYRTWVSKSSTLSRFSGAKVSKMDFIIPID